jgi:hypothetical protein
MDLFLLKTFIVRCLGAGENCHLSMHVIRLVLLPIQHTVRDYTTTWKAYFSVPTCVTHESILVIHCISDARRY